MFRKIENSEIEELKKNFSGKDEVKEAEEKALAECVSKARIDIPEGASAEEIEKMVQDQGDLVRRLKKEKADKSQVTVQVTVLKQLKEALQAAKLS